MPKKLKKVKKTKKTRKLAKKKPAKKKVFKKKAAKKSAPKTKKPVGKVTHFYNHIRVAIVKFNTKVPVGTTLRFKGATTDFAEPVKSMQYNHEAIKVALKGKQIGIKVKKRVRDGDLVYKEE